MPKRNPTRGITLPKGFRAAGVTCGIKPSGKPDLALIVADVPCAAAGVFTQNKVPGAPVQVGKQHLRSGVAQAIICNSGISNVATGKPGIEDAKAMAKHVAAMIHCKPNHVLPCSTGVIGVRLPIEKILTGIKTAAGELTASPRADRNAANAIITTDLATKAAQQTLTLNGKKITLGGVAKGSGMIAPNMATMLVFITTDVAISSKMLKQAINLSVNADASFNRMSVDHDTSTSDSLLVMASGLANNRTIKTAGQPFEKFTQALTALCQEFTHQVIWDGEGATRIFRVKVKGAASQADANRVGKAVVGSPLVKTAVHGCDPNWGRLAMAVGKSGAKIDQTKLSIEIGHLPVMKAGVNVPAPLGKLNRHMKSKEVQFTINLGLGKHKTEWLGCDLSREYIAINADYTT
jgi:glutamate N-acetyltransferase / amino-acid N-acetyltransferase